MGISPGAPPERGHSAFAGLEMIRSVMEADATPFGEAVRDVAEMTVFTTHTPVAAGHDRFPPPWSRSTWASSARRCTCPTRTSWGWGASTRAIATSPSA
ncbi:MAG: hypothetical protein WKF75_02435 [Singulisphaera sp.]